MTKQKRGLSLRARLTLSVVAILSVICLAMTLYTTFVARSYFTRIAVAVPMQKLVLSQIEPSDESSPPIPATPTESALSSETISMKTIPATMISAANAIPVVYDSRRAFSVQSILVLLAAILGGAAMTYALTGRALRPLSELSRATKRVGAKNLAQRVTPFPATDEVGELSRSFNIMMERLEKSFTAEKRFSGNAAHELKTPLATMKTSLQVLAMDASPSTEEYAEFADTVGNCVERMIRTVESLTALTNEDCTLPDTVDVFALLQTARTELSAQAHDKDVQTELCGESILLRANEPLLHRAFSNIIENAIKYHHTGGSVKITVSEDADCAKITVRDDGSGIPAEDLEHVFEAFYRADKSRSQNIPGSGLGLAIVKVIIEKHGGTVAITSDSHGTTVTVRLPLQSAI